jgi:MoaA/NifB/PqqE/SkfB family radical SAM enzyme
MSSLLENRERIKRLLRRIHGILSYDRIDRNTKLLGPLFIQIQTMDKCNASCIMCPYTIKNTTGSPNYMEGRLYKHILHELKHTGSVREFSPVLQNEPLMDREIAGRVREAKEVLGSSVLVHLVTNGSLLNSRCVDQLLKSGLDILSVSIDAFKEETYKFIHKGLSFSRVVANLESLLQRNPRIVVLARFLIQKANAAEEKMFRQYWKSRGARVVVESVHNRAGILLNFDQISDESLQSRHSYVPLLKRLFRFCPLPFYKMNVLWDGRVLLCCHDWGPSLIVGDLTKQSLREVWNGEEMNYCRHLLYNSLSEEIPLCSRCSYKKGPFSNSFRERNSL